MRLRGWLGATARFEDGCLAAAIVVGPSPLFSVTGGSLSSSSESECKSSATLGGAGGTAIVGVLNTVESEARHVYIKKAGGEKEYGR